MANLSPSASEASKLLEAALQQMDGIIQGAKFDHVGPVQTSLNSSKGQGSGSKIQSPVNEALQNLHSCLLQDDSVHLVNVDAHSVEFIFNWLRNNLLFDPGQSDFEADRENFQFQMSMLNEQLERQNSRITELEQLLAAKNELLKKTEVALEREQNSSSEKANSTSEQQQHPNNTVLRLQSDLSKLKTKCNTYEKENFELRRLLGGDRTPKYLPISSPTHPHSSPSPSSSTPETEYGPAITSSGPPGGPHLGATPSPGGDHAEPKTPKQSFKKIFGKIKRSNSGGHLQENGNKVQTSPQQQQQQTSKISMVEDNGNQTFRRGGLRATAGGRLGWSTNNAQTLSKKPFSDWSLEVLCVWMDSLGLGMYNTDLKKLVNHGDQLAKMSMTDLEHKLGIKSPMHRKKLVLGMKARQDTHMEAAQGGLDHHWVTRWLDDVGLPQYKDTFFEARVDGRVLNVLTVEDLLIHMKITNLLHHLSIRRGIQVLRHRNFSPDCLKRRAVPGEANANNIELWTNHRVMEWLKEINLSEYAPNLRGSGVHGALVLLEPKFTADFLATLLSIPSNKTLLRRHLNLHFKDLVGKDTVAAKRLAEQDPNYVLLTPTAKAKTKTSGQFTLKRKKSKSQFDYDDLLCPFEKGMKKP